jgi:hypothetical protein
VTAAVRARVVELSRTAYAGTDDSHFRDRLAEREGIVLSLSTVRRMRRAAGEGGPRQRRPPAHRQRRERRERRPQAGMLLQLDGSPRAWLEGRGPRLSLLAAIDDATGAIAGAVWREQEDGLGYLALLAEVVRAHGRPEAVYHDRAGIVVHHAHERGTLEEQLAGERQPRQVERAFAALGIASITAHSPQAGAPWARRVERLFTPPQDRLVAEPRLAGAATRAEATAVLAAFPPRFNVAFAVPAAVPGGADRPVEPGTDLRQVCCLTERRVVANDDTIQFAGQRLQLLPGPGRRTYARAAVEVRQHLGGALRLRHGERELAWRPAPPAARALRAAAGAAGAAGRARPAAPAAAFNLDAEDRADVAGGPPPAVAATPGPRKPAPDHPWRAGFATRRVTLSPTS